MMLWELDGGEDSQKREGDPAQSSDEEREMGMRVLHHDVDDADQGEEEHEDLEESEGWGIVSGGVEEDGKEDDHHSCPQHNSPVDLARPVLVAVDEVAHKPHMQAHEEEHPEEALLKVLQTDVVIPVVSQHLVRPVAVEPEGTHAAEELEGGGEEFDQKLGRGESGEEFEKFWEGVVGQNHVEEVGEEGEPGKVAKGGREDVESVWVGVSKVAVCMLIDRHLSLFNK